MTDLVRAKKHLGQHFLKDETIALDIVKSLSNNSADVDFNKALNETQKSLGVNNNDDFITAFEKRYKQNYPNGRLAPLFQSIENKNKISYNSTNDEVIKFIRERVSETVGNAEKTFRSRIYGYCPIQVTPRPLTIASNLMKPSMIFLRNLIE